MNSLAIAGVLLASYYRDMVDGPDDDLNGADYLEGDRGSDDWDDAKAYLKSEGVPSSYIVDGDYWDMVVSIAERSLLYK